MTRHAQMLEVAGELLRDLGTARQSTALYPPGHPKRSEWGAQLVLHARDLRDLAGFEDPTMFIDHGSFYLGNTLLASESLSLGGLAQAFVRAGIESMTFGPQLESADFEQLVEILHTSERTNETLGGLRLNAVRPVARADQPWEERLRALRGAYASGVEALREAGTRAAAGQPIDIDSVNVVVETLVDEVAQDPGYGLLLSAVKSYDEYTYFHMVNVCLLSVSLGQSIGLRRDQVLLLGLGGLLHDIGKVNVPTEILQGTGGLDEEQWRIVQQHPSDGAAMLFTTGEGLYHPAASVLLEHHAAYDQNGYPALHGHSMSAPSRLVAVADCFDAITSKRCYREPVGRHQAMRIIRSAAGTGLDPAAVAAFHRLLGGHPTGTLVRLTSGETAVVIRQHERLPDRPVVLIVLDKIGTPVEVEQRDLAEDAHPNAPAVAEPVTDDQVGIDMARFAISGEVHATSLKRLFERGGLVHEPSPGEPQPKGYVDTHAHERPSSPEGRPDPGVAPSVELDDAPPVDP